MNNCFSLRQYTIKRKSWRRKRNETAVTSLMWSVGNNVQLDTYYSNTFVVAVVYTFDVTKCFHLNTIYFRKWMLIASIAFKWTSDSHHPNKSNAMSYINVYILHNAQCTLCLPYKLTSFIIAMMYSRHSLSLTFLSTKCF